MRANVARHARRLLVRRVPLPSCAAYAHPARRRHISRPLTPRTFQRTFIGALFSKAPREVRAPEYEPGWMQIMVWRSRMLDNLRPPPRKDLIEAWKKLMQAKRKSRMPLNSTQALQCRRLLDYLAGPSAAEEQVKAVSSVDLSMAREVLLDLDPHEKSQNHIDLAKAIYNVWLSENYSGKQRSLELQWSYLVRALCRYGGSREALEMLYDTWDNPAYSIYHLKEDKLVEAVARGLASEGHETELVELVEYAETHGVAYDVGIQEIITTFFAERDRIPETKHWLGKSIDQRYSHPSTYRSVAAFAMRNDLQDWAIPLFLGLGQSQPKKRHWDIVLQAILLLGKSLDEVGIMMSHMVDRNGAVSPDIKTINGLLSVAVETKDLPLAAKLLALGPERGLTLNGDTFMLVWKLRLETGDLAGCQGPYEQVQHYEPWLGESSDSAKEYGRLTNRYLVALCQQAPPDFGLLTNILVYVDEQRIRLDPETVAVLCLKFLENDQHFDVIDILSLNSFFFSEAEREVVQKAFATFCLNPGTSTNRAWSGYQLLHQFFQDTSFERRVKLVEAFFDRRRPDMASQVFVHMRQHRNKMYHPTADTYIQCLEGFSQNPDIEGLDTVYNLLKLDTAIQPSTRLFTALMLAYTASDQPLIALDSWNEITQLREGPSYASLEAVFWTLERKSNGYAQAREIWERIERMDLEVPPGVYNAYVGAIAGAGREDEVRHLISNMASVVGSEPDAMTLGVAYNALPGQGLQSAFQDWAKTRYSEAWAELSKKGRRVNELSLCQFKIKRALKA